MIGFFDTCIHVALMRGTLELETVLAAARGGPIRMSPVVGSELLRSARPRARRSVELLVERMRTIEPLSWRAAFLEAGRLLPEAFTDHEAIGLARLQNDVLLALTARHSGAVLVTFDRHFDALRRHVDFQVVILAEPARG